MKTTLLNVIACAGLASSAFAGHEMYSGKDKGYMPPEPCFKDQELQVDLFGSYTYGVQRSAYGDGFGGGLAVNYFFMRYLGVGLEGNVFDGAEDRFQHEKRGRALHDDDSGAVWNLGGRILARYPLELGGTCLAPYIFVGGGVQFDGLTSGTWLSGAGLEWRATQMLGIFTEGRYTWAGNQADSAQGRVGVRVVF